MSTCQSKHLINSICENNFLTLHLYEEVVVPLLETEARDPVLLKEDIASVAVSPTLVSRTGMVYCSLVHYAYLVHSVQSIFIDAQPTVLVY